MLILSLEYFTLVWVICTMFSSLIYKYLPNSKLSKFIEEYLCIKCLTFWTTLILTQSIFIASIAAFYAFIYDNFLNITKL